jgi:hypothetical protein
MKKMSTVVLLITLMLTVSYLTPIFLLDYKDTACYHTNVGWSTTSIDKLVKNERIAKAIKKTKYPYTLAAIAKRETGGTFNPNLIGDRGQSFGLYQIQEKHWGKFDKSIEGQTKKAEEILDELIKAHRYTKAVERWNGSGRMARVYRDDVLKTVSLLRRQDKDG